MIIFLNTFSRVHNYKDVTFTMMSFNKTNGKKKNSILVTKGNEDIVAPQ